MDFSCEISVICDPHAISLHQPTVVRYDGSAGMGGDEPLPWKRHGLRRSAVITLTQGLSADDGQRGTRCLSIVQMKDFFPYSFPLSLSLSSSGINCGHIMIV